MITWEQLCQEPNRLRVNQGKDCYRFINQEDFERIQKDAQESVRPDPMRDAARACVMALSMTRGRLWAETFMELRLSFFRKFQRRLVVSTIHGIDFFSNVIACCEVRIVWDKDTEKGEYGDNFRELITERPRV